MAKKQPAQALRTDSRDGQVSAPGGIVSYFLRNMPMWNPPAWQEAYYWRTFVEKQPFAAICRDTIANYLNSLEWKIVARDTNKRDELRGQIKHYTKLFERGNAYYWDIDFSNQVEWFVKDLFTLPFGTASELGRLDDNPEGRVVWIRPLDGGTLAPTLNFDFPIVQSAVGTGLTPIYIPKEFVSRVYLSPRTELQREGWGYAPPERIWRAIEMMITGDNYYAQLLLNTPEAGILDLGDMDKTSAVEWVNGLKDLFYGVSPFKIPVLYEHEKPAQWIPFGKPPSEIMYDSVTMRYAAILAAGYGLTLSDIGYPTSSGGGDTLAGTIRMERVGKSSGKSIAKKKFEAYANRILPYSLKFTWIDYDDERNVSKGRARLATAQAGNIWISGRSFLPSEIRQQAIADGLFSIDLPEDIDENDPEFTNIQQPGFGGSATKELNGKVQPSSGGQGEVIPQQVVQRNMTGMEVGVSKAAYSANEVLASLIAKVKSNLDEGELGLWEEYIDGYLIGKSDIDEPELKRVLDDICKRAVTVLQSQSWAKEFSTAIHDKVVAEKTLEELGKAQERAEHKAEEEFITGKSDSMDVSDVEIEPFDSGNLHGVIFESLTRMVAQYAVLISKSRLISGELDVDPTEFGSHNIRISRDISREVLQNLSSIIDKVYNDGMKSLQYKGELDAIS